MERIREKSVRQTTRLIALAEEAGFRVTSPKDAADRGGTITVGHEDAAAITKELIRREFIVDYRPGAGVRISPHFYTSDEELELVIREMKEIRDTARMQCMKLLGRHSRRMKDEGGRMKQFVLSCSSLILPPSSL